MNGARGSARELKHQVLVMLAAAMTAVLARWWGGYPNCPTDELNWAHIAQQLDQGVDWPVSGPLYLAVLRALGGSLRHDYPRTLALMGVLFVPLAMLALIWGYRRLGVSPLRMTLLALCLSSYFWAALIESRPQQWGQVLVLVGGTSLWLALSGRGPWLVYAATLVLTAFTHILSYALLVMLSLWLMGYFFLLRNISLGTLARCALALALSAGVFLLPGGPYGAMLNDIAHNHLQGNGWRMAGLAGLGATAFVILLLQRHHLRDVVLPWFEHRLRRARARPLLFGLGTLAVVGVTLSAQAAILPADAWRPYGGSVARFALSQSGNLAFATLVVAGWIDTVTRADAPPALRAFTVMGLGWACIGALLLAASAFLLDTNWLLRVLNYAILFGAPLAAVPLAALLRRRPAAWLLVTAIGGVSFMLAVRHLAVYSC